MFFWTFSNKKSRSSKWYITSIIGVLVFLVYGIISGVYMMSVASLLFAGVFLLMENNSTPMSEVEINNDGLRLDSGFYKWNNFVSFGIFSIGNLQVIRFVSKNKIASIFDIPLSPDINSVELIDFVSQFVEQDKTMEASNVDNFARIMQI